MKCNLSIGIINHLNLIIYTLIIEDINSIEYFRHWLTKFNSNCFFLFDRERFLSYACKFLCKISQYRKIIQLFMHVFCKHTFKSK
jgi:hypothetical protein